MAPWPSRYMSGTGTGGRGLAEVDEYIAAVCQMCDQKSAAADITAARVRHGLCVTNCHRSVDRIATRPQYFGAGLGG